MRQMYRNVENLAIWPGTAKSTSGFESGNDFMAISSNSLQGQFKIVVVGEVVRWWVVYVCVN